MRARRGDSRDGAGAQELPGRGGAPPQSRKWFAGFARFAHHFATQSHWPVWQFFFFFFLPSKKKSWDSSLPLFSEKTLQTLQTLQKYPVYQPPSPPVPPTPPTVRAPAPAVHPTPPSHAKREAKAPATCTAAAHVRSAASLSLGVKNLLCVNKQ